MYMFAVRMKIELLFARQRSLSRPASLDLGLLRDSFINTIYKTLKYSTQEYLTFPDFTEDELYDYVNNLGRPKWAELIKNPVYQDGQTHYSPGISNITFRLTGTNENGERIEKYIICEIAMGC